MFSVLRRNFGTAGLVVSVIALIAALAGGAVAANSGSGGKATASAKGKRGPTGPRGPKGATGAAGAVGPAGPQGAVGANGQSGATGPTGKNGTSAVGTEFGPLPLEEPAGKPCEERGGTEIVSAGPTPTFVCNGEEGSPWTAGGTLPPGATETGVWTFVGEGIPIGESKYNFVTASFTIPLEEALGSVHLHYVPSESTEDCPGTYSEPAAAAGEFCLYQQTLVFGAFEFMGSIGTSGVQIAFETSSASAFGIGSWAVTAPTS